MTDKGYRVIVSKQAAQMLVSHAAFLAGVSVAAAERLTAEFEESTGSLAHMPYRGRWLEGKPIPCQRYRYLIFGKWYLLVYQVVDDTVYVDHVIDGRQDYRWLFER